MDKTKITLNYDEYQRISNNFDDLENAVINFGKENSVENAVELMHNFFDLKNETLDMLANISSYLDFSKAESATTTTNKKYTYERELPRVGETWKDFTGDKCKILSIFPDPNNAQIYVGFKWDKYDCEETSNIKYFLSFTREGNYRFEKVEDSDDDDC